MREVTQQIYTFEELSETAQEKVTESWIYTERQFCDLSDNITYEMTEFYLKDYGLQDLDLQYSLSHCQGDGVAFYGKCYDLTELIKTLDIDTTLNIDSLDLEISHVDGLYNYNHYNTMTFTLSSDDDLTNTSIKELQRLENKIGDGLRLLAQKLETVGYNIIEFHLSEENAKESILANEYEYLKDGTQY